MFSVNMTGISIGQGSSDPSGELDEEVGNNLRWTIDLSKE